MFFIFTVAFLSNITSKNAKAEAYTTFERIDFKNEDVILMDEWSYERENSYLNMLSKNKMFGWDLFYAYQKEPFEFLGETMYHVKNAGYEDIVHTFSYSESYEKTIQRSVKGQLELEIADKKKNKKDKKEEEFKFGLEGKLEFEYKQTEKTKTTESDTVKITVAPGTELFIKVMGKGYLYSGAARKFFMWIKSKEGSFEYVIITTEYYSIEMNPIEGYEGSVL